MSTSPCASLRSALADAGVGGPRSPALEAHLAGCASCRAELDTVRGLSRRIDEELRATLAAEPSPAMAPRVRARVEAARAGGGLFAPRWLGWAAAMLAVAGVAYLAAGPGGRRQPSDDRRTTRALASPGPRSASAGTVPTPASPSAVVAAEAASRAGGLPQPARATAGLGSPPERAPARAAMTTAAGARSAARAAGGLPIVLVAPDEERALALFVASLERRRAEPGSLLAGVANAPPLEDLKLGSISVEPLTITPLGRTE